MLLWWLGVVGLAGCAMATCPQHCSCFTDPDGYVSANCSVEALGQTDPSPVEMLSFQPRLGGYGTRLYPRAFLAFGRAKFLWMVNCSVLNLPKDVFHGLTYVIRIDLSFNKIRHLNGAVFKPLESLTTLKLRSNPLELTPWDVIVSDSLQELDLGHCGLRTIPFGTFTGVPRLSRLSLDGNELKTLTYNTVPSNLRYVNLARNKISVVPTDVLTAMSNLRKIDLSKNPVNCTCNLLIMQDWFSGQGVLFDNGVVCVEPSQYKGMRLSRINENELCTLEEVKRQRRINELHSYRDSKSHRTHNMIHDPDLQSDQPNDQNYAEVLFHDDGLTHMEISNKHYSLLPQDFSGENNKVAASKQELRSTEVVLPSPTRVVAIDGEEETSKEELTSELSSDLSSEIDELALAEFHNTTHLVPSERITSGQTTETHSHSSTIGHVGIVTTEANPDKAGNVTDFSETTHDELSDEGYSPVYNMTDMMLSDGEGSGDDSNDPLLTNTSIEEEAKNLSTSTPGTFTFPSSLSDVSDYSYDSHHDYSGEATTESMSSFVEEGSGEAENETAASSSIPPILKEEEDNETTTETYLIIDNTTSNYFSSSTEDYNVSSSVSDTNVPYNTTEPFTDDSTSESTTETFEASSSSSASPIFVEIHSSTQEPSSSPASSSEAPTTLPAVDETSSVSSTTEAPSSSSVPPLIPAISTSASPETEPEETTTETASSAPVLETEIVKTQFATVDTKGKMSVGPAEDERRVQSLLTYVIAGLLVALIVAVVVALICKKAGNKKKVRLPTDLEATPGTELQDMLLPRPAENGVKILPTNGKEHGKEEEKEVLSKDWDDKSNEPIETVTARLSVLAGPQTPVFIHKTLA